MRYSVKKLSDDRWELWQSLEHMEGTRRVCDITTEEIMALYEEVVPEFKETILVAGEPSCRHLWVPYKINHSLKMCTNCSAMIKIERLIPRRRV